MLDSKIRIDIYIILRCNRNRQVGGAACYLRNDLSYNILSAFPRKVENVFFETLMFKLKPVTVEFIYWPPAPQLSQSNFLEVLNNGLNEIDSVIN